MTFILIYIISLIIVYSLLRITHKYESVPHFVVIMMFLPVFQWIAGISAIFIIVYHNFTIDKFLGGKGGRHYE